jgi:hypothetical protein
VFLFFDEFRMVRKDVKFGIYPVSSYIFGRTLVEIPFMIFLSVLQTAVPMYAIGAFYGGTFLHMVLCVALIGWAFEGLAQISSLKFKNPALGMVDYLQIWFACFLFMGFMVPEEDVIWPFRILCIIDPLKWGFRLMLWSEFAFGPDYAGVAECTPELEQQSLMALGMNNMAGFICTRTERDWYCPDYPPMQCYGGDGETVLKSAQVNFDSTPKEDTYARDIMFTLVICIVVKVVYAIMAMWQARPKAGYRALKAA